MVYTICTRGGRRSRRQWQLSRGPRRAWRPGRVRRHADWPSSRAPAWPLQGRSATRDPPVLSGTRFSGGTAPGTCTRVARGVAEQLNELATFVGWAGPTHGRIGYVPLDTSPDALRVQIQVQRQMGGSRRFRLACEMSRTMRQMARSRITSRCPGLDERGILDEMMRELYGFRRDA